LQEKFSSVAPPHVAGDVARSRAACRADWRFPARRGVGGPIARRLRDGIACNRSSRAMAFFETSAGSR
jgi:hypothetical protein